MNKLLRWASIGVALGVLLATGCSSVTPRRSAAPAPAPSAASVSSASRAREADFLTVCSFNIQWLGQSTKRDNAALAELLKPFDIVVVQELIAAPAMIATDPAARQRSAAFFREMGMRGFSFYLSESDTGPKGPLGSSTSKTEWWVTFFRSNRVLPATDVPHGFLSSPLAKNVDFDRVPYALGFRTVDKRSDFVLISVHLNPDDRRRRAHELGAIGTWIGAQSAIQKERDFIVLGDTNIQNQPELHASMPAGLVSLNDDCVATNVSPKSPKPYDQVFFDPVHTTEIDRSFGFQVINLIEAMRSQWNDTGPYPGDPYLTNVFRLYYSDHDPVAFRIQIPSQDDD